jgi:hypothetical protein
LGLMTFTSLPSFYACAIARSASSQSRSLACAFDLYDAAHVLGREVWP